MDLREAGIAEQRAPLVRAPDGGGVARLRHRGEIEDVAVAAGGQDDGVGRIALQLAVHHVPGDDAPRLPVHQDKVEHLAPGVELHLARLRSGGQSAEYAPSSSCCPVWPRA